MLRFFALLCFYRGTGEESVLLLLLLLLLLVGGFRGTVFGSPMYTQNGCFQKKYFKMGVSRENFSSKWVYPEKTFLKSGCIQSKFSSKWVYPEKIFLKNGCIQRKLFFQKGAFTKYFCCKIDASKQNHTSRWVHQVPFFYRIQKKNYSVSLHVITLLF